MVDVFFSLDFQIIDASQAVFRQDIQDRIFGDQPGYPVLCPYLHDLDRGVIHQDTDDMLTGSDIFERHHHKSIIQ